MQNGLAFMEELTTKYRTMGDVSSMPEIVVEAKKRIRRPFVNLANVSADSCHQECHINVTKRVTHMSPNCHIVMHNANLIYPLIISTQVSHNCHKSITQMSLTVVMKIVMFPLIHVTQVSHKCHLSVNKNKLSETIIFHVLSVILACT